MRHDDGGHAVEHAPQDVAQLARGRGVDGGQGLVEQQQSRRRGERPGERDALGLPARERPRTAACQVAGADGVEQVVGEGARRVPRGAVRAWSEHDVAANGQVSEEVGLLVEEPDGPLPRR